jgi:phosphohistidine phosphatase
LFKIKYLVLWRHAEAMDSAPDHARELTAKGRQQAKRMATWLNAHLPADAVVLVSPAVRAQQTAKALKRSYTTCDALDTSANSATLLKAVAQLDAQTVLVVGHQPTLGQAASRLLTRTDHALSVKKGAVWWIGVRPERKGEAVLHAVMTPEML